jgi:hypothetical protein
MVCISKQHVKRALSNEVTKSDKPFTDTLYSKTENYYAYLLYTRFDD